MTKPVSQYLSKMQFMYNVAFDLGLFSKCAFFKVKGKNVCDYSKKKKKYWQQKVAKQSVGHKSLIGADTKTECIQSND